MKILGIRVDELDMQAALEQLTKLLEQPGQKELAQVVTINPEGIMLAKADPELRKIVEQAELVTADGTGILWAAEKLGKPMKERVTGIDLLEKLAGLAAEKGWRIYLLGAKPGIAEQAAAELCCRYPGLQIVGTENGYFRDREAAVLEGIHRAEADILFAALGMPFQEKWLHQHRSELGCRLGIGVGGCFDVLAGTVKRAPLLWQRLRLEWLWRLLSDPKRWRRYLAIPRYMRAVLREKRQIR
ncbi:MAG: WecB/TagA/CpsF family glycosyltransferase [Bacillota bacterium]|nr:WecB/TagA/CpsF family glycosyltransferase [Bacillota bacterium]